MSYLINLLALLALALPLNVNATPYDINWTNSSLREDGVVLLDRDVDHYNIYWGTRPGDYQYTINTTRFRNKSPYPSQWTVEVTPDTDFYFVMTAVDTEDRESMYSNPGKLIMAPPPGAPTVQCAVTADLDGDGVVNGSDLAIMKRYFFTDGVMQ